MNNNNMQENLCESIQYFSKDPNMTHNKEEIACPAPAIRAKRQLVLDDPFKDQVDLSKNIVGEIHDFENLNEVVESSHGNFKSSYRTINENYKSVGSKNKSKRSPAYSQQKIKPPRSPASPISVKSKKENYNTHVDQMLENQDPL